MLGNLMSWMGGLGRGSRYGWLLPWTITLASLLFIALLVLANSHLVSVQAAGTGTNVAVAADSIRMATGDFNATVDVSASNDVTAKLSDNVLAGTAATLDLAETTGTTSDRYITIRETVAAASYDGQIILRVYVASIDQPLRFKIYPYSSIDPSRVFLASSDSYPIAPNTLTSNDVYRPIINLIPRSLTADATRDAGWININVTHLAQFSKPSTTLKLKLGLEMPSGTDVKASISEVRLNFVSNAVPHDNYMMLTTEWCGQCHSRHNGGQNTILRPPIEKAATPDIFTAGQQTKEEAVCFVCHDGTGSTKDLRTEFRKAEVSAGGSMRIWRYLGSHNRRENTASGDTYDYVADGANGLMIIDTSNPASPTLVASIDTPGTANDVVVHDQYAFVADGSVDIEIIELENPAGPRIIASYDGGAGNSVGIYVSSKDAYVAAGSAGVRIVNVSNRTAPTLTASIAGASSAEAVIVQGGTRPYTTNSGYTSAGSGYGENTYLFVARGTSGVSAYDVTNPAAPGAAINAGATTGDDHDIYIMDNNGENVYVAHGSGGVTVFPFTGSFGTGVNYNTSGDAQGIFVQNDETDAASNDPIMFIADGANGVSIVSAGAMNCAGCSTAHTLLGVYDTSGIADDVNVVGNYVYVADDTSGLQILNSSNLRAPTLTGTYNTPGNANGVSFTYSTHVECFDCHNPHLVTFQDRYRGKRGINASGEVVGWGTSRVRLFQYEVCFQCHGSSVRRAVGRIVEDIPNTFRFSNKTREFNPSNSAYHPVEAPGRNRSVNLNTQLQNRTSGLTYRLSTADTIVCADCHNNDLSSSVNGPVANYNVVIQALGLHGSIQTTNKRAFFFNDFDYPSSYQQGNFALCFLCHDPGCFIGGSCTNFYDNENGKGNAHEIHLEQRTTATCKTCHFNIHSNVDAANTEYRIRGVGPGGSTVLYFRPPSDFPTRLINFAPDVDAYNQDGVNRRRPEWEYCNGQTSGSCSEFAGGKDGRVCSLQCHGGTMANSNGSGGVRAIYDGPATNPDVPFP